MQYLSDLEPGHSRVSAALWSAIFSKIPGLVLGPLCRLPAGQQVITWQSHISAFPGDPGVTFEPTASLPLGLPSGVSSGDTAMKWVG